MACQGKERHCSVWKGLLKVPAALNADGLGHCLGVSCLKNPFTITRVTQDRSFLLNLTYSYVIKSPPSEFMMFSWWPSIFHGPGSFLRNGACASGLSRPWVPAHKFALADKASLKQKMLVVTSHVKGEGLSSSLQLLVL